MIVYLTIATVFFVLSLCGFALAAGIIKKKMDMEVATLAVLRLALASSLFPVYFLLFVFYWIGRAYRKWKFTPEELAMDELMRNL
jgi:uncharacterized membrane protein